MILFFLWSDPAIAFCNSSLHPSVSKRMCTRTLHPIPSLQNLAATLTHRTRRISRVPMRWGHSFQPAQHGETSGFNLSYFILFYLSWVELCRVELSWVEFILFYFVVFCRILFFNSNKMKTPEKSLYVPFLHGGLKMHIFYFHYKYKLYITIRACGKVGGRGNLLSCCR